jgi:vitamin B12 transporter
MYTYLDANVTDPGFQGGPGTEFEEGQSLLRRPAYTIAGGARYDVEGVGLSLRYRYVGSRADLDFSDFPSARVTLPAYHVVDVSGAVTLIGHQGGRSIGITARVENLLDERYQEIYGFAAPGRTVMVGVRVGG